MPKVSDYELEHFNDDSDLRVTQKIHRKKKQAKDQKRLDKKDHRSEWKRQQRVIQEAIKEDVNVEE